MKEIKIKVSLFMVAVSIIFILIILVIPIDPNGKDLDTSLGTTILRKIGLMEPKKEVATVILGGDVMLGRSVMARSLDVGEPKYPFIKIGGTIEKADLAFVNLENAIVEDCPKVYEDTLIFCGLPSMLEGLKFSGINVVTLANNHSKNYGDEGFDETKRHLEAAGILYTGVGNLVTKEVNGIKFGFLGFMFIDSEPQESDYELIRQSKSQVDILIVGTHWGVEYKYAPEDNQKEWAKKLVEAGADIIAGHHPHWVQTSEKIGDSVVYYSLGNLVFDQMWSENTRSGVMIRLTYEGKKLVREDHIRTYMSEWAQPEIVESE